ncbi:Peroxidase [Psidium guajava]|nr:Peroxidase [Psidium guajava]
MRSSRIGSISRAAAGRLDEVHRRHEGRSPVNRVMAASWAAYWVGWKSPRTSIRCGSGTGWEVIGEERLLYIQRPLSAAYFFYVVDV